jgi:phage terminase large subunit-like protein
LYLLADAIWREPIIDEIVEFPAEFDDQVDVMTEFLDYMDTKPIIGIALGSHYRRWAGKGK